jgi:predicted ABC-type ATPase
MERVAMRVTQGGHDVPDEKLAIRYPRSLENLRQALSRLPHVLIYDNSDLTSPLRQVAVFEHGSICTRVEDMPSWLADLLP